MSMMGMFREIPPALLDRLNADPSLSEEIVRGTSAPPLAPSRTPDVLKQLEEKLPQLLAQNRELLLNQLPPDQRQFVEALPEDKKDQFYQTLYQQLTNQVLSSVQRPAAPRPRHPGSMS